MNFVQVQVQAATVEPSREFSTTTMTARIPTDGILLYVSEASYQPVSFWLISGSRYGTDMLSVMQGETPLSCWIPARPLDGSEGPAMLDVFERYL